MVLLAKFGTDGSKIYNMVFIVFHICDNGRMLYLAALGLCITVVNLHTFGKVFNYN